MDKRTIASKVESLEEKCNVKKTAPSAIIFLFHMEGEPHGCFGSQRMIVEWQPPFGHRKEALTYEEEMDVYYSKPYYDELVKQAPDLQKAGHIWSTYEKWLEDHRCKCGKHGADGKQPYNGER